MPYKTFDNLQQFNAAQPVLRLLDAMDTALDDNPYQRPAHPTPPTITVSSTSDGTLTSSPLASGGALTSASINQIAWYGGVPAPILTQYVCLPVTSIFPQTSGNIGSGMADKNQWASAMEIMTDSDKVQLGVYISNAAKMMFQVDGRYVDFTGTPGNNAANTDTFFLLTFASRRVRRIRFLIPNLPSKGCTLVKSLRISPTCSFWKPSQSEVLRVAWAGDSLSEGTNGAASIYPIPNAAWPVVACELLGLRDCRQVSVGSCGYLSDNGGLRRKLRDQIPFWTNQGPFDLIVFANCFNDAASDKYLLTAEVLYCLRLARTLHPTTPIVVLGCHAGNTAPGANQLATDAALKLAVDTLNDPIVKFAPISSDTPAWVTSANAAAYLDPDLIHYNVAGAEFAGYRAAQALRLAVQSMV